MARLAAKQTDPAAYAYAIPECFSDAEAAPLLCAGAVGYRALNLRFAPIRGAKVLTFDR
jgi:D-arabinose 1-dehydrogenase-like Zn-dependent alcohol dehydrogenase